MLQYPKELLPRPEYKKIESDSIKRNGFIRGTEQDIYELHSKGIPFENTIELIIGRETSKKDVFELSLFLYGIFREEHIKIRVNSDYAYVDWDFQKEIPDSIECFSCEWYPLFFKAEKLYSQHISFQDINCILSYEHKPTCVNYWHFQLFTEENNRRLTRGLGQKRYSRLAKHILETVLIKAICEKNNIAAYSF